MPIVNELRRHPAGCVLSQMGQGLFLGANVQALSAAGIGATSFDTAVWWLRDGPPPTVASVGVYWRPDYQTDAGLLTESERLAGRCGRVVASSSPSEGVEYPCTVAAGAPLYVQVGGWMTYRPYAADSSGGLYYGNLYYARLACIPQLATVTPVVTAPTTANSGGTFNYGGGSTITARFVILKANGMPTLADHDIKIDAPAGDGTPTDWAANITGMTAGVLYGVRAGATNGGSGDGLRESHLAARRAGRGRAAARA